MSEFFGEFSWPKFIDVLPVYATAAFTLCLLVLAYVQIQSLRDDSAKRAAFDFFFSVFRSERHIKCRRAYCLIMDTLSNPESFFNNSLYKEKIDTLYEYLDFQEMFSIGVLNGGISEKYAKEAYELIILQDWDYLKKFVLEGREINKSPKSYENFELLCKKWSSQTKGRSK